MRTNIERWLLIALLMVSYLSRVPGLLRQGIVGMPALIVGLVIVVVLVTLLTKSSSGAALLIAIMAGLGAIFGIVRFFVFEPIIRGYTPSSPWMFIPSVIAAFCAVDLWSEWGKKPNKAPEPTPTSVTPPANER